MLVGFSFALDIYQHICVLLVQVFIFLFLVNMLRLNPQVLSNASVVELFCKYTVFTWLLDVLCVCV